MANKEAFYGTHQSEFTIHSLTKREDSVTPLFDVNIGTNSLGGTVLGGIGGLDEKEVDQCFTRQELLGSSVFRPIVACKKEGKILLIGEEVGKNFEDWLKEKNTLWKIDGRPIDELVKVGRALFRVVTRNHQKNKYIGNIREGLRIKGDESIVIVPSSGLKWSQGTRALPEGIKKDLRDLRWFVKVICEGNNAKASQVCKLFNALCPDQSLAPPSSDTAKLNLAGLLKLSYIMCHYPIFWGTHERYLFAGIIRKMCSTDKFVFSRFLPLDTGMLDVGTWFDKVTKKTTKNQNLHDIYFDESGSSNLNYGYDQQFGISSFIGNAYEHYFDKDKSQTIEKLDNLILELFPHIFLKIYGGVMKFPDEGQYDLYHLLQSGGINFGN